MVSTVMALLIAGLVAWRVMSRYPPYAIPRPTFNFSFCQPPLWLHTQGGYATRLGDCMGELAAPAKDAPTVVVRLPRGSTFAMGCMPNVCPAPLPTMTSSKRSVVAPRGMRGGETYFQVVGRGRAAILVRGVACILPNGQERLAGGCSAVIVQAG